MGGVLEILQYVVAGGLIWTALRAAVEVGSMKTRLAALEEIVKARREYRR